MCIRDSNYGDPNICLRYYVTSGLKYLLLRFLEYHIGNANGHEAQYATQRLLDVILLFESDEDVEDFAIYVHRHLGSFDDKLSKQREPLSLIHISLIVYGKTKYKMSLGSPQKAAQAFCL